MEIERKFLLGRFPNLPVIKEATYQQGYITVDPEVRLTTLRRKGDSSYEFKLTSKSEGDLSREETERILTVEEFVALLGRMPSKDWIVKEYKQYALPCGLCLETSLVDKGRPTEFMYAEVEFSSAKEALAFTPPAFLGEEVTYNPEYKMKNYWATTRLKK